MSADTVEFYRMLLAHAPGMASLHADLAQALLAAGDVDDAIGQACEAVALDPELTQAWLTRAAARKALGEFEAAAEDFQRAAALAPGRPMVLVNLALCHAELDRLDLAERHLRAAVAFDPRCKQAQANLGSVLVKQGRLAEAEAPCRAALALDPGLIAAHQNLSGILAADRPAEARAHRDTAYASQQIFIEPATRPARTVLVLVAADAANVPWRHLLPRARTTLIQWYVEYAPPGQERALPPYDCIFNAIGDPDLAPGLPPHVATLLREQAPRVLNDPARIARTRRSDLPALLVGIPGVLVPNVVRHEGAPVGLAEPPAFPVLVRPIGSHGGDGARRIDDGRTWATLPDAACYVTEFVDFRSPDGWHRKYRVVFVAGRPYPCHLAIGPHWLVHHYTSGMERDAARRAEEGRFLDDPQAAIGAPAMHALHAIGERLGLDYAGIDFALLPDGRVLVFEANATMLVHPERDPCFAYRNPAVACIQAAFDAMVNAASTARSRPDSTVFGA